MEITKPQEKEIPQIIDPVIEEMTKAGLHFGHKTSKTYPKMKPFLAGIRNTIHIFDLEKTKEKLEKALAFIFDYVTQGKVFLFVGTKVQLRQLVEETAKSCNAPFISQRWIGGTFTNFETIAKRINQMLDLEKKQEAGELEKYTKKEQLKIAQQIQELEGKYGGLRTLTKPPDAIFICDLDENQIALREAKRKGIPVVAICDTNIDPTFVNYVIPANDDAISSVSYILNRVKETVLTAKSQALLTKDQHDTN